MRLIATLFITEPPPWVWSPGWAACLEQIRKLAADLIELGEPDHHVNLDSFLVIRRLSE